MKKLLILLILILTISSCESGKKFNSYDFEGNYEMRTTMYWENDEGVYNKFYRDIISPVQMYVMNEHLFVWTNNYGMPNMDAEDLTEVEYTFDPPVEPVNPSSEGEEGEVLEAITVTVPPQITIIDGFVVVIRDAKHIKSHPIEALDVQVDKILFRNSKNFDVSVTDPTGTMFETLTCHFEYAPATLLNDTITWDVELSGDVRYNSSDPDPFIKKYHAKYHNTLVRQ